jgi:hypothetical protein
MDGDASRKNQIARRVKVFQAVRKLRRHDARAERLRKIQNSQRESLNNRNVGAGATRPHTCRSTIIILSSAIASEGLRLFGQALAQFMMVWQR